MWQNKKAYETVGHNISTESNMKRSREQYYIYKYQSKDNYDHYIMLHLHRGRGQDP